MAVAQGINKSVSIGIQVGLGTPNVTTGQILRRKTSVFSATRDMYESDEIVSHHQSTGSVYGLKKATGKIDGLLSPLTYQLPIEGLLEALFVATTPLVLGTDVTTSATAPQFVDASAGFLAGGIKVGDVGRFTGFTTTATGNNSRNFLVTALTASNMTGVFLDGTVVSVKAPETGSVTFTVVGKKCKPPLTGHTNSYYTFEEWYSDITKSELFPDCKIGQLAIGLPASGNSTISVDVVGLGERTLASGAQQVTTRAAETTTSVMGAINGFIYINGAAGTNITGASLQISNSAAGIGAVIGSNSSPDVAVGRIKVSGSITGFFDSTTITAFYDAETKVGLALVLAADNTATSAFMGFTMGKIAIGGDAPDDGEKGISRTYPFTAELNGDGGAALAWDQTIITVQDSAAA